MRFFISKWQFFREAFREAYRVRRPLSAEEMDKLAITYVLKSERPIWFRLVGMLTVAWTAVEVTLDYANLLILTRSSTSEKQLPVSLKPKIGLFKKSLDLPEFKSFREEGLKLVERINQLKEVRHDVVHGYASAQVQAGIRTFIRHSYKGVDLGQTKRNYSMEEIFLKVEEIAALAEDLQRLVVLVHEALPDARDDAPG